MVNNNNELIGKCALVTGGAQRIGASIVRALHGAGMNVLVHFRRSREAAETLCAALNSQGPGSAIACAAELNDRAQLKHLVETVLVRWGRLDVLVNNAARFYPTPMQGIDDKIWDDLIGTNLKAPLILSQYAAPLLSKSRGCIVNIVDIHGGEKPLHRYPLYSVSKAGLAMLTYTLAKELAPDVRVNGVSPGPVLWPEDMNEKLKATILSRTPLARPGSPEDIAKTVLFLVRDAPFITGEIINVDGGRHLFS
jgi:pteridine reductase